MRSVTVVILLTLFLLSVPAQAQDDTKEGRTYFDNLTLDPDGHICYVEFLDGSAFDRIEYREEGRGMISLYSNTEERAIYVETKDFDDDKRPDIITVEWTYGGTDIRRVTYYRGRAYSDHLTKHLRHALGTASRHIIKDREEERGRVREIRSRLQELEERPIEEGEVGIFSSDDGFLVRDHKDIRYAFVAADNLNKVLSEIVSGDYKVLSQKTDLTKEYKLDIDILLALDPSRQRP